MRQGALLSVYVTIDRLSADVEWDTVPRCVNSPTGSWASCTAASRPAPSTTKRPRGHTTPPPRRRLTRFRHGMSAWPYARCAPPWNGPPRSARLPGAEWPARSATRHRSRTRSARAAADASLPCPDPTPSPDPASRWVRHTERRPGISDSRCLTNSDANHELDGFQVTEEGLADALAEIVVRGMRGSGGQVHGPAPAAGADLERGVIPSRGYTSVDRRNDQRRPAAIVDRDVASGDSGFRGAPQSAVEQGRLHGGVMFPDAIRSHPQPSVRKASTPVMDQRASRVIDPERFAAHSHGAAEPCPGASDELQIKRVQQPCQHRGGLQHPWSRRARQIPANVLEFPAAVRRLERASTDLDPGAVPRHTPLWLRTVDTVALDQRDEQNSGAAGASGNKATRVGPRVAIS
jgi:hypothetical protein